MNSTTDNNEFLPPKSARWSGPMGLAVAVHVLLIGALTWGVQWRQDTPATFEAELWSPTARQAAPRAVEPPPPPPPPKPEPKPEPRPAPEPKPQPAPEPAKKDPDIATEQARKQKEAQERKLADEQAKKAKAEKERKEKQERDRKLAEEKKLAEQKRQEDAKRLAEQKRKEEEDKRKLAEERQRATDAAREDQMRRILGQAGATGGPTATGTAQRASGPSSGYGSMVAARIRPNIIYSEEFPSSLRTEVEVRTQPDGRITDRRVVRSSGNRNWDEAALRAIDRTGSLPRDTDGRVPTPIVIVVRPMD